MDESKIRDSIEGHLARNVELKQLIASKGVSLDERSEIDLHFWASNEQAASDLAQALYDEGYGVASINKVGGSELWNVFSQIDDSPLAVTQPLFVEALVRLAARYEAEFDGWGTLV